jgi:hypothetical protein
LHFLRIDNKKINLNRYIAGTVINRPHDFVQIQWVVEGADPYEIPIRLNRRERPVCRSVFSFK